MTPTSSTDASVNRCRLDRVPSSVTGSLLVSLAADGAPIRRRSGTCLDKARRSRLLYTDRVDELLDLDLLDDQNPFEIDAQAAHLFKHPHLGLDDVYDV